MAGRILIVLVACVAMPSRAAEPSRSAEPDPIKIAILVDGMASRGSGYDASELHGLGMDGLAAVLDYLLPDTAPANRPLPAAPPEAELQALLERLDHDDFHVRERATEELIARARGAKALIEQAAVSDSLEVRLRAERVLASWESRPASRLSAYLSGFWAYIEGLSDPPRLALLAERAVKACAAGMPEGDRLHLVRLCIAGVAHGRHESSCALLRPLVRNADVRVATLVTETVGAYKTDAHLLPALLVDALEDRRPPVVEAALRFVLGCNDVVRRPRVQAALRRIFDSGPEPLKFQACFPLVRDFQDAAAWAYVIEQAGSSDTGRVRTALNWIGDTKRVAGAPPVALLTRFDQLLAGDAGQRRAVVLALGKFGGTEVVKRLVPLVADADETVVREAEGCLASQPDRALVQRLLREAASGTNSVLQSRAQQLLAKFGRS
jgi:hypothetical protein